jgi:hypothetical protein
MNNTEGTNGVPLTVFGGAVPELAPEDLPEGASPYNQDCDYNPGSVFTRGGRANQITYQNLSVEEIASQAADIHVPNGTPWINPGGITHNTPGNYAQINLNQNLNFASIFQNVIQIQNTPTATNFTATLPNPVTAGSYVAIFLFVTDANGVADNVIITGAKDNLGISADVIATGAANVQFAGFTAYYKSVAGGAQTYTCTLAKNAGGNITASPYTMTVMEVVGTNNAAGADPTDYKVINGNLGNTQNWASATNVVTTQANELLIWACVQNNSTTTTSSFMPNTQVVPPHPVGVVFNQSTAGSGEFRAVALGGQIIPVNPATQVTFASTGVTTSAHAADIGFTLKMSVGPTLAHPGVIGTDQAIPAQGSGVTSITFPTVTPSSPAEVLFCFSLTSVSETTTPVFPLLNWGNSQELTSQQSLQAQLLTGGTPVAAQINLSGSTNYLAAAITLAVYGSVPPPWQRVGTSGAFTATTINFSAALTAGNAVMVYVATPNIVTVPTVVVTDSTGDLFAQLVYTTGQVGTGGAGTTMMMSVFLATNTVGGNTDVHIAFSGLTSSCQIQCWELPFGLSTVSALPVSDILQGSAFIPPITSPVVLGMEIELSGHQTFATNPNAVLTVSVPGQSSFAPIQVQLPAVDGMILVGTPLTQWGVQLTPAFINQTLQVNVQASAPLAVPANFFLYKVGLRVFVAPSPATNINWIKTYEQTNGEVDTLVLDANGVLWDEDVDTNPSVLNSIPQNILPNTFAKSVTFQDIEYIAFSNLVSGTDVPRQWNGTNLDRISQVGPGQAPTASPSGGPGGSNITAIQNTVQSPPTLIRRIAWGSGPTVMNDSTPGNLLIVFGQGRQAPGQSVYTTLPPYTPTFGPGTTVVLSNITNPFPKKGGGTINYNINGSYTVQQVTTGIVGGNESPPLFIIPAPTTTYGYSADFGEFGPPPATNWTYQSCIATVTTQAPLPNVLAGSQIQITGTGNTPPGGFDGTWTVLSAPNATSMTITSVTSVANGSTVTYTYGNLVGPAPVLNQLVSISNVIGSAGPPNFFNVSQVAITSVSGVNQFSINLSGAPDMPPTTQAGNSATAIIGGTKFTFDAGQLVTTGGGTINGGSIVGQGQVGIGARKCCVCFLTRSGYITQPSPIGYFSITSGSGSIQVSNIPIGPPNVIARIVCFTGANGGNFFYIPQDVIVVVPGAPTVTNTSTIINNNTDTTAKFNFSDTVLLSATAIDIQGNNLFNDIELGSCRGLLTYASRMFAWSEQAKVTNLRNWSFDGGRLPNVTNPLGWTIDATNGTGGSLNINQPAPVFGWTYQIQNTSGSTQAIWGMLTQSAYKDEFGVAILQASVLYSVRITASVSPAQASGNLVVDLFDGVTAVLGTFSIPLASMSSTMQIYTGTLLTPNFLPTPIPPGLQIRIWAQNVLNGATILIDRVEPFPTITPVLSTAFKASYVNNQEAFDLVTGVCGPAQNMQPLNGGMVLFDLLYALKERSWYSTFDNGVTEPNQWTWKEVSPKVGTIGIHSYDWGEGWGLTGNREGIFFFEGGEPIKVSQEIQPLWDMINWNYGYSLWVRNDPEQKRFTVGVPIATPNVYMPEFPANPNPTSPNVILACNYRELNTGAAMAQTGPIRSTFTGRLMSPEPARKWSFWNIVCPYSDYIDRANNTWPQWLCTGYNDNKIFQLQATQLNDDGTAVNSFWISYGFVKPEAADAKGLGLFRMEFPYFTVLATGSGTLNSYVYPESPQNRPYVLDPQSLPAVSQGDLEIGVNIKGQRFFIRVGTNAVGSAFRCSKMVVPLLPDPWSPIRGSNLVTA